MSWAISTDYKGIPFVITSGWRADDTIYICLSVEIEEVRDVLMNRGEQMLEGLRYFTEIREELFIVYSAGDIGFGYWSRKDTFDEYERKLNIILESDYADEALKTKAQEQIEWIATEKQKQAQKKAKRVHSMRRRTVFAQKRDELMLALIERDGYSCTECGELEGLTIDHIIPLSKGGSDTLENLQLLCQRCNSAKGDKMP